MDQGILCCFPPHPPHPSEEKESPFVHPLGHAYGEGSLRPWEGALKQRKGVAFPAQICSTQYAGNMGVAGKLESLLDFSGQITVEFFLHKVCSML